jgi:Electron transfer flavoprotein, alpha subunit
VITFGPQEFQYTLRQSAKCILTKLMSGLDFGGAKNFLVTVRPGSLPAEIEAAAGAVDITQADILVSVGRGVGDAENIPLAEALAQA